MLRSIKYELKPTKTEQQMLNKTFGCVRFIYNWALDLKSKSYSNDKVNIPQNQLSSRLTMLKKQADFNWLNEVGSQQLQASIANLDSAYSNFFKKKSKYPKFKSKRDKQAFRIPQNVKINYTNYTFFIPKVGWVKFFRDKHIQGTIKFATVTRTPTNRYFVSVTFESYETRLTGTDTVGLDLGIKFFAITSDGEVFENQKYLKSNLKNLRIQQRKLRRKFKQGQQIQSANYYKQKLVVAKLHEKIANQRKDHLHKISTTLTRTYHTICIEDLATANMLKNHKLAQSIQDCSWRMFREMLLSKAARLVTINRFEPTSQVCNICGDRNKELKLSQRTWVCRNGHELDRDHNAAINIKNIGMRVSSFDAKVG